LFIKTKGKDFELVQINVGNVLFSDTNEYLYIEFSKHEQGI